MYNNFYPSPIRFVKKKPPVQTKGGGSDLFAVTSPGPIPITIIAQTTIAAIRFLHRFIVFSPVFSIRDQNVSSQQHSDCSVLPLAYTIFSVSKRFTENKDFRDQRRPPMLS